MVESVTVYGMMVHVYYKFLRVYSEVIFALIISTEGAREGGGGFFRYYPSIG